MNLHRAFAAGMMGASAYDYVVALSGDDTNLGSSTSPWRHLSKISSGLVRDGKTTKVLVKAGLYDAGDADTINISGGTIYSPGTKLELHFEPGVIIDGTAVTATRKNCFGIELGNLPVDIFGNGLVLREFNVESANLLGTRDNVLVNAYDIDFFSGEDGITGHGSETVNLYRCVFRSGVSRPVINVGSSTVNIYDSVISGSIDYSDGTHGVIERTTCTPRGDGQWLVGPVTMRQCIIGSPTTYYEHFTAGVNEEAVIEDSYINLYYDGPTDGSVLNLTRCFGKLGCRVRNSGLEMRRCVITENSGQGSIFGSNYDPGYTGKYIVEDNIFVDPARCGATSQVGPYLVAAGSEITNNFISDSMIWGVDLDAIDTGTSTADPLIGPADSTVMADYAWVAGSSPAEGAGVGGGDVGFSVDDALPVGAQT